MRGERTAIWKKKYCLNSHSSNSSEKVLLIARALSYSVFLLHARSNLSRKSWHSKRTEWTYTLIKKNTKTKSDECLYRRFARLTTTTTKNPQRVVYWLTVPLSHALSTALCFIRSISHLCVYIFFQLARLLKTSNCTHMLTQWLDISAQRTYNNRRQKKNMRRDDHFQINRGFRPHIHVLFSALHEAACLRHARITLHTHSYKCRVLHVHRRQI